MTCLIVVPAYGRDYKTPEAAIADWVKGKDFVTQDISCRWPCHPTSIRDVEALRHEGYDSIKIRFNRLEDFVIWTFAKGN